MPAIKEAKCFEFTDLQIIPPPLDLFLYTPLNKFKFNHVNMKLLKNIS